MKKIQKFRNRNTNFIPNEPLVPVRVTNRDQMYSSRSTCPRPCGGPLVPVRKQPELKAGAFSPALLVPVATTETNGLYKPGLKAFFLPVKLVQLNCVDIFIHHFTHYTLMSCTSGCRILLAHTGRDHFVLILRYIFPGRVAIGQ
jgi:hypothetical protein